MAEIHVPPRAEIIIRLNQNGAVSVTGPFQDQLLFYGLLKIAEQVCHAQAAQAQGLGGKILVPELKPPKL